MIALKTTKQISFIAQLFTPTETKWKISDKKHKLGGLEQTNRDDRPCIVNGKGIKYVLRPIIVSLSTLKVL